MSDSIYTSSRAVSLYIDELLLPAKESLHHVQGFDCHGLCLGVWAEQVSTIIYNIETDTEMAWREAGTLDVEGRCVVLLDPAKMVFPMDRQPPEPTGVKHTCLLVLAEHDLALWCRQPRYFRQPDSGLVFRTKSTSRNWLEATCSEPVCAIVDTQVVAKFADKV